MYKLTAAREQEIRNQARHVVGIRLLGLDAHGAEFLYDFTTLEAALVAIPSDATDWVIFELVQPSRYSACGRTLASVEAVS